MPNIRMDTRIAQLEASAKEIPKLRKDITSLTASVILLLQQMKENQHSITLLTQNMGSLNPNRAESSNNQLNSEEAPTSDKTIPIMPNVDKTLDKDRFPRTTSL